MPKRGNEGEAPVPPGAAAAVFALLVLATLAAFAYAQRVKRDPLVLDRVSFVGAPRHEGDEVVHSFTPDGDCHHDLMRIRFRVTVSDEATVQVVKPGGRVVYTLARDEFLKRYHFFTYYWDGRQRGGGTAHRGRYKLRVKLGSERILVTPGVIRLHRVPERDRPRCPDRASGSEHSGVGKDSAAVRDGAGAGAGR
jgi:hypothetical protein